MFSEETVQRFVKALYPVGAMLLLVPLADLTLRQFPPQFDTLQWRFGMVGLLMGNLGTIMLGLGLLGLVSAILDNRTALRIIGFASIALAVVVLGAMTLFALDAIQIRRLAAPNFKKPILVSSLSALFSGSFGVLTSLVLGRGALVAARGMRTGERRPKAAAPIVVGRSQVNESV